MIKLAAMGDSFGKIDGFSVGDMVFWTKLNKKMTGIVSNLRFLANGGRNVAYATTFCFEDNRKYDVLCVNLKVLTKNEVNEQKN